MQFLGHMRAQVLVRLEELELIVRVHILVQEGLGTFADHQMAQRGRIELCGHGVLRPDPAQGDDVAMQAFARTTM